MKKGQMVIEFLLLVAFSVTLFLALMYGLIFISASKTEEKSFAELDDFARSMQQEFILAASVQDGYQRTITVPATFNAQAFSVMIINSTKENMLLEFTLADSIVYYRIPAVAGTLVTGSQQLIKENGELFLR